MKFFTAFAALALIAAPVSAETFTSSFRTPNGTTYCSTTFYGSHSSTSCGPHDPNIYKKYEHSCSVRANTGKMVETGLKHCPPKFLGLPVNPTEAQILRWASQQSSNR